MNVLDRDSGPGVCVFHPRRPTALRCGKCDRFICTRCMIQTPVGVRCRDCAQLRRLPQFDVGGVLLARSVLAGLAVSVIAWLLTSYTLFLRFFLSVLVGLAVGEAMSRLARRRSNRVLEVLAVADVVAGLLISTAIRFSSELHDLFLAANQDPSVFLSLVLPAVLASYVAIVKLR